MNPPLDPPRKYSPHEVRRCLSLLHEPGSVFEIRIPKWGKYKVTAAGYFDDVDAAIAALGRWDGRANIYVTMNAIDPALLARSVNRIDERMEHTTADADVRRRRWLLLDVDAVRPAGISSAASELEATLNLARIVRDHLQAVGWPEPVEATSGNGAYLLYHIDLPNDEESLHLVAQVLGSIAARFDSPAAKIDTVVGNAARLLGVLGTVKVKGDPTDERPHRRSGLTAVPATIAVVPRALLEAVAASTRDGAEKRDRRRHSRAGAPVRLAGLLDEAGIEYQTQPPDARGITWYHLRQCPFHDDGRPFECGVGQALPDGPFAGHCFHPEGRSRGWRDFKAALGLNKSSSEDDAWETPVPLTSAEPLPTFPVDVFPDWLRDFVLAEAVATQTPRDLSSMLVLSALACGAAKRAEVEVRPGWREPLNLWTATALEPGNRKSAVFGDVTRPIIQHEINEATRLAKDIAEAKVRLAVYAKELTRAQDCAAKEKDANEHEGFVQKAVELQAKIDDTQPPIAPRLIADDATPERLTALMAEHGGRMAVMSAEGEIFEQMAGKYQSGTQGFNVFLKGHSGDDIRVDRVGRAPDYVHDPSLTLGLTVQPAVIRGLAERSGFRGRGLLARLLFALPTSTVGTRDVNPPPMPQDVRDAYTEHLTRVVELAATGEDTQTIRLTGGAHNAINEMSAILEPTLARDAQFGFMADWAAKLPGTVVRVAGLLHIADCVADDEQPWARLLPASVVDRAREVATYLLLHAMAAIRMMGEDAATSGAQALLDWLRRQAVNEFSVREAHRANQTRFRRAAEVEAPLLVLSDHGYIRPRERDANASGRPAGAKYVVNPIVHAEAA